MAAKLEKTRTPGVYRRGSRYVVVFRDGEGRQRRESARTYDDARRLKSRRGAAVEAGEYQAATRVRLRVYAEEWVDRYQGKGKGFRESTREDYRRDLRRYVVPFFDERHRRTLEQITPRDVANFVAWLCDENEQGRHLADATVRRILAPLRACLRTATAEGLIRSNPTVGATLPTRDDQRRIDEATDEESEVKAFSSDELAAFLAVCPKPHALLFRVLAATGIRISELIALRWRDLQLDGSAPVLRVRRAYVRGTYGPPKSKTSRRDVPLPQALVYELRAWRKATEWMGDDELVFPAMNGQPIRQENLRRRVLKPTAEEVGAGWAGFHTFRHTCATRLFADGRNAVQVQRWLGHHSPGFTLATYVHLLDEDLGGALEEPRGDNGVTTEATETARKGKPAYLLKMAA